MGLIGAHMSGDISNPKDPHGPKRSPKSPHWELEGRGLPNRGLLSDSTDRAPYLCHPQARLPQLLAAHAVDAGRRLLQHLFQAAGFVMPAGCTQRPCLLDVRHVVHIYSAPYVCVYACMHACMHACCMHAACMHACVFMHCLYAQCTYVTQNSIAHHNATQLSVT